MLHSKLLWVFVVQQQFICLLLWVWASCLQKVLECNEFSLQPDSAVGFWYQNCIFHACNSISPNKRSLSCFVFTAWPHTFNQSFTNWSSPFESPGVAQPHYLGNSPSCFSLAKNWNDVYGNTMLTPNGWIMTSLGSPRTPNPPSAWFSSLLCSHGTNSKKTPGDVSWQV